MKIGLIFCEVWKDKYLVTMIVAGTLALIIGGCILSFFVGRLWAAVMVIIFLLWGYFVPRLSSLMLKKIARR